MIKRNERRKLSRKKKEDLSRPDRQVPSVERCAAESPPSSPMAQPRRVHSSTQRDTFSNRSVPGVSSSKVASPSCETSSLAEQELPDIENHMIRSEELPDIADHMCAAKGSAGICSKAGDLGTPSPAQGEDLPEMYEPRLKRRSQDLPEICAPRAKRGKGLHGRVGSVASTCSESEEELPNLVCDWNRRKLPLKDNNSLKATRDKNAETVTAVPPANSKSHVYPKHGSLQPPKRGSVFSPETTKPVTKRNFPGSSPEPRSFKLFDVDFGFSSASSSGASSPDAPRREKYSNVGFARQEVNSSSLKKSRVNEESMPFSSKSSSNSLKSKGRDAQVSHPHVKSVPANNVEWSLSSSSSPHSLPIVVPKAKRSGQTLSHSHSLKSQGSNAKVSNSNSRSNPAQITDWSLSSSSSPRSSPIVVPMYLSKLAQKPLNHHSLGSIKDSKSKKKPDHTRPCPRVKDSDASSRGSLFSCKTSKKDLFSENNRPVRKRLEEDNDLVSLPDLKEGSVSLSMSQREADSVSLPDLKKGSLPWTPEDEDSRSLPDLTASVGQLKSPPSSPKSSFASHQTQQNVSQGQRNSCVAPRSSPVPHGKREDRKSSTADICFRALKKNGRKPSSGDSKRSHSKSSSSPSSPLSSPVSGVSSSSSELTSPLAAKSAQFNTKSHNNPSNRNCDKPKASSKTLPHRSPTSPVRKSDLSDDKSGVTSKSFHSEKRRVPHVTSSVLLSDKSVVTSKPFPSVKGHVPHMKSAVSLRSAQGLNPKPDDPQCRSRGRWDMKVKLSGKKDKPADMTCSSSYLPDLSVSSEDSQVGEAHAHNYSMAMFVSSEESPLEEAHTRTSRKVLSKAASQDPSVEQAHSSHTVFTSKADSPDRDSTAAGPSVSAFSSGRDSNPRMSRKRQQPPILTPEAPFLFPEAPILSAEKGCGSSGGGDPSKRCRTVTPERMPLLHLMENAIHVDEDSQDSASIGFKRSMSDDELKKRVLELKTELRGVYYGTVHSDRRQRYMEGGASRRQLDHDAQLHCVQEGQEDVIMDTLLEMFTGSQLKNLDFVMRVMLPEALARIHRQSDSC